MIILDNKTCFLCVVLAIILVACADTSPELRSEACRKAIVCDDFDDDKVGEAPSGLWQTNIINDNIDTVRSGIHVSSDQSYSGPNSVKFVSQGGGFNRHYLSVGISDIDGVRFPGIEKKIYGRMRVKIDAPTDADMDFTLVQAEGRSKREAIDLGADGDTMVMYRYRVAGKSQNRQGNLMANYDTYVDKNRDGDTDWLTDCYDHSAAKLPRNEWVCLQWYFDSEENTLRYWLGDDELSDSRITHAGEGCLNYETQKGQWLGPKRFDTLHLGIEQYATSAVSHAVYIDDVVIGSVLFGCSH